MTTSIEVEPELFAAIKQSVVDPLQSQDDLFKQLGYEPAEHFGEIVAEIAEGWQVTSTSIKRCRSSGSQSIRGGDLRLPRANAISLLLERLYGA